MSSRRFLFILMGILLVAFGYAARAQVCSDISIFADDTIINENDIDTSYFVLLENDSDRVFLIENVSVTDDSSFLIASHSGNEEDSVEEFSSTGIFIDLEALSVTADRSATVTVKVSGRFSGSNTCSLNDIQQTFIVDVIDNGSGTTESCADIGIQTFNFHVPESSTSNRTFSITNNSAKSFVIDELLVSDNSTFFSLDRTYFSTINANSSVDLNMIVHSSVVSSQQSGTGTIRLRGHFSGGRTCSLAEMGQSNFTVTVDNTSAGTCGTIVLNAENVFVDEESAITDVFTIRNNSNRTFTVDEARVDENSPNYRQSISNFDSIISPGSTGNARVRTIAESVAGNRTASSTFKVRGHFSDGNTCGFSELQQDFLTTVRDIVEEDGDEEDGEIISGDCSDLSIDEHAVEVNANDTTNDSFFLRNDSIRNFYIDSVNVSDSADFFATSALDFEKIAKRNGEKARVNFSVQAYGANLNNSGTATMQVHGHFSDGKTCSGSQSFAVNVNAVQQQPGQPVQPAPAKKLVEIISAPDSVEFAGNTFIAVTVRNNSASQRNITIGFAGFPSGLMLETNNYNVPAASAKTIYLDIDSRGNTGTFSGTIFVQSDSTKDSQPITLVSKSGIAGDETGAESESGVAGTALLLLSQAAVLLGIIVLGVIIALLIAERLRKK